jgi:hypothetical protein
VIAPWREWDLLSRTKLIEWAEARGISVPQSKRGEPLFSMDANLLHISYEGARGGQGRGAEAAYPARGSSCQALQPAVNAASLLQVCQLH